MFRFRDDSADEDIRASIRVLDVMAELLERHADNPRFTPTRHELQRLSVLVALLAAMHHRVLHLVERLEERASK